MLALRGGSSDVYTYTVTKCEGLSRTLLLTVTPTGAGGGYLPESGWEAFVAMCLWEQLPFTISRRSELAETATRTCVMGGIDLGTFWESQLAALNTEEERLNFDVFHAWNATPLEQQQRYLEEQAAHYAEKQRQWMQLCKQKGYNAIAELSVDDICGDMGSLAWKFVQHVSLQETYGNLRIRAPRFPSAHYDTRVFRVTLTHGRYMPAADVPRTGTTNYPQLKGAAEPWAPSIHWRFPVAFHKRVFQLLMIRNRRDNPLNTLSQYSFYLVCMHLAACAHDEEAETAWENGLSPQEFFEIYPRYVDQSYLNDHRTLLLVFQFLDKRSLRRCSFMSKAWRRAASEPFLWQKFLGAPKSDPMDGWLGRPNAYHAVKLNRLNEAGGEILDKINALKRELLGLEEQKSDIVRFTGALHPLFGGLMRICFRAGYSCPTQQLLSSLFSASVKYLTALRSVLFMLSPGCVHHPPAEESSNPPPLGKIPQFSLSVSPLRTYHIKGVVDLKQIGLALDSLHHTFGGDTLITKVYGGTTSDVGDYCFEEETSASVDYYDDQEEDSDENEDSQEEEEEELQVFQVIGEAESFVFSPPAAVQAVPVRRTPGLHEVRQEQVGHRGRRGVDLMIQQRIFASLVHAVLQCQFSEEALDYLQSAMEAQLMSLVESALRVSIPITSAAFDCASRALFGSYRNTHGRMVKTTWSLDEIMIMQQLGVPQDPPVFDSPVSAPPSIHCPQDHYDDDGTGGSLQPAISCYECGDLFCEQCSMDDWGEREDVMQCSFCSGWTCFRRCAERCQVCGRESCVECRKQGCQSEECLENARGLFSAAGVALGSQQAAAVGSAFAFVAPDIDI